MRRADRLLRIVQALRRHRGPMTAQALADELEVSRRTIYRDMLDLQAGLVPIEGEAGIGYVLRPGYDLPPLMFTLEEIEAIVLGAQLARNRGDAGLARAVDDVLAKVSAVLPRELSDAVHNSALLAPAATRGRDAFGPHLEQLRHAVRQRAKLSMAYQDLKGTVSERVVWPLALLFFAHVTLLGSWCERRGDYRFFRTDRIRRLDLTGERFNAKNGALLEALMAEDCHQQASRRTHGLRVIENPMKKGA